MDKGLTRTHKPRSSHPREDRRWESNLYVMRNEEIQLEFRLFINSVARGDRESAKNKVEQEARDADNESGKLLIRGAKHSLSHTIKADLRPDGGRAIHREGSPDARGGCPEQTGVHREVGLTPEEATQDARVNAGAVQWRRSILMGYVGESDNGTGLNTARQLGGRGPGKQQGQLANKEHLQRSDRRVGSDEADNITRASVVEVDGSSEYIQEELEWDSPVPLSEEWIVQLASDSATQCDSGTRAQHFGISGIIVVTPSLPSLEEPRNTFKPYEIPGEDVGGIGWRFAIRPPRVAEEKKTAEAWGERAAGKGSLEPA
ncbi:hypothetical protein FB451DRAFT_1454234 [Mycena latifolia]|nr:hypothetical protein FB451DRAFT_1454234 [Mycena latifolia]